MNIDSVASRTPKLQSLLIGSALIFLLCFGFLAFLSPDAFLSGDDAVYAQQVLSRDFSDRPVHIGYYLVAALLTGFSTQTSDYIFNLLSCFFGSATLALVFFITTRVSARPILGGLAVLVLTVNYIFLENAIYAEIYIVQCFFLILALWLFWRTEPIRAGISFAAAIAVTPSSILAGPSMIVLKTDWRRAIIFGLVATALVSVLVIPNLQEYLFGPRGLFEAASSQVDFQSKSLKETREVVLGYLALTPFIPIGLWALTRTKTGLRCVLAAGFFWSLSFVLVEKHDAPVQLPIYVFLGPIVAVGALSFVKWISDERRTSLRVIGVASVWALSLAVLLLVLLVARPRSQLLSSLDMALGWMALTVLFLGGVAAIGFAVSGSAKWTAIPLVTMCLAANAIVAGGLVWEVNREMSEFKRNALRISEISGDNTLVIGTWTHGILFEHYVFADSYTDYWIDTAALEGKSGPTVRWESHRRIEQAVQNRQDIWLLGELPKWSEKLADEGYSIKAEFEAMYRCTIEPE